MSDGKIPNQESGFLDPAQSLMSCATSEKSPSALCLTFPTSRIRSLDHMFAEVPQSLKLEPGLSCNMTRAYDSHTRPALAQQASLLIYSLDLQIFQHQAINNRANAYNTHFWVKSIALPSEDGPGALGPGGTLCPPVLPTPHPPTRPLPQTFPPAYTTPRTRDNLVPRES